MADEGKEDTNASSQLSKKKKKKGKKQNIEVIT